MKKCDFCSTIVEEEKSCSFGTYDAKGLEIDAGDLCKSCYAKLDKAIDSLKAPR